MIRRARDETKIFTGVQHFRQPIDRSLFIRGAHALYKCADRIVVGLASTVVHDSFLLNAFLRDCEIEMNGGVLAAPGSTTPATVADVVNTPISRAFKALRALPSLTSARNPQGLERNLDVVITQTAFFVCERAAHQCD
jgi:hypothetical protein